MSHPTALVGRTSYAARCAVLAHAPPLHRAAEHVGSGQAEHASAAVDFDQWCFSISHIETGDKCADRAADHEMADGPAALLQCAFLAEIRHRRLGWGWATARPRCANGAEAHVPCHRCGGCNDWINRCIIVGTRISSAQSRPVHDRGDANVPQTVEYAAYRSGLIGRML